MSSFPSVLASHGYPVLAVAYFGVAGLPPNLVRIPLDYFRAPLRWLRRQDAVDLDRVVVFGVSYGGELALLLGATYPDLVDAVVGYVPSSVVSPAVVDRIQPTWTLRGRPVRDGLAIPVERISGPVFVVGGGQDALWPSGSSVEQIRERLARSGRRGDVALLYADAGHAVGVAVPNTLTRTSVNSRYGELYLGGSPAADENAREDSWRKLLEFLARL